MIVSTPYQPVQITAQKVFLRVQRTYRRRKRKKGKKIKKEYDATKEIPKCDDWEEIPNPMIE